jgi:hypothetical protein
MRNPFRPEHTREQVDGAFDQLGWGTKVERRVPRDGGEPLYFQIRLPNDLELVDIGDLVPTARELPTVFEDRVVALEQVQASAGVVVVGAMRDRSTPDDVFATTTVVYSEHVKDPGHELEEGKFTVERPGEKSIVRVKHLKHGHVTHVQRTTGLTVKEGAEPVPVVTTTFLVPTKFGGLALSFSSSHAGGGSEEMHDFYSNVYGTMYLGDSEPPTDGRH